MRRTDALTTFLSGVSLLILGPVLLVLFLQWWMIVLVALAITGFAVWSTIEKSKEELPVSQNIKSTGPGLAPEVLEAIKYTLANPYCSRCGEGFRHEAERYCSYCGEVRSYKPLSALIEIDTE